MPQRRTSSPKRSTGPVNKACTRAWEEALNRVRGASQRRHYMPCMLLAVLDLIEQGGVDLPEIRFEAVDRVFHRLVEQRSLAGADQGWNPFFHLAGKPQIWTLHHGGKPSDFSSLRVEQGRQVARPKSRSSFLKHVDCARFVPELVSQLGFPEGRAILRERLTQLMRPESA